MSTMGRSRLGEDLCPGSGNRLTNEGLAAASRGDWKT